MTTQNFESALATFLQRAQQLVTVHYQCSFPELKVPVLSLEPGRRYVRVVKASNDHDRGVYCFVDRQSGAVLKAESWKKPHPRPRGTIYSDKLEGVTEYGGQYIVPGGRPVVTLTTPDRIASVTER